MSVMRSPPDSDLRVQRPVLPTIGGGVCSVAGRSWRAQHPGLCPAAPGHLYPRPGPHPVPVYGSGFGGCCWRGGGLPLTTSVSSSGRQPATGGYSPGPPLPPGRQPDAFRLRPAARAVRSNRQVSVPSSLTALRQEPPSRSRQSLVHNQMKDSPGTSQGFL